MSKPNSQATSAQTFTYAPPPLTLEEEEAIIYSRLTNDERPLRRVIKKLHNYTSVAFAPVVPPLVSIPESERESAIEDARESFLVELATFELLLRKNVMICKAEARQVEEYQRERQRIEDEHGKLRGQIEQLKTALEHEQLLRRRKIEYDLIAEKINALPSREELELTIQELENDMAAIRAEHETQNRTIQSQKSALDGIVSDLASLRFTNKEQHSQGDSPSMSPLPDSALEAAEIPLGVSGQSTGDSSVENGEISQKEDGEDGENAEEEPGSSSLNPSARAFTRSHNGPPSPSPGINEDEDDIEMGEVAEEPKIKKKVREEELEEGEASDVSSVLSDPPDD